MMSRIRCASAAAVVALLVAFAMCALPVHAEAVEPEPASLEVALRVNGEAIESASFEVWRIGDVATSGAMTAFPEYAFCQSELDDPSAAGCAELVLVLADELSGSESYASATTSNDGIAAFGDLPAGLYLLVGERFEISVTGASSKKMEPVPCLVRVPEPAGDGTWLDVVKIVVKSELVPEKPTYVPDEKLPQTGQLWWPVPVLLAAGLILLLAGARQRSKNRPN